MTEFQKAALELIRDTSVQLILIAVGAVSVVGSVFGARTIPTKGKKQFLWAMRFFIVSVLCGLIALGAAVSQLSQGSFDPWAATLRIAYLLQLVTIFIGGGVFFAWLVQNISWETKS